MWWEISQEEAEVVRVLDMAWLVGRGAADLDFVTSQKGQKHQNLSGHLCYK